MTAWEPYMPRSANLRVTETSCCGTYEWCSEGGQFLVLRYNGKCYEEAARGRYAEARLVWNKLVQGHRRCRRAS